MSDFTYQSIATEAALEEYEWDNVWWEKTSVRGVPRALYIGDSISCAIRRTATALSENAILFDGIGTSKAPDNPCLFDTVRLFASQMAEKPTYVLYNCGLHGWHLDSEEYKTYYEGVIRFLISEFPSARLYLVLTTSVSSSDTEERVKERNRVVSMLANTYDLELIDLYTPTSEHPEMLSPDGVHYLKEGCEMMAQRILEEIAKSK